MLMSIGLGSLAITSVPIWGGGAFIKPLDTRKARAFSAAACSADFFDLDHAVKVVCSKHPIGVCTAGIVRVHVKLGRAGGRGPLSIENTGIPPVEFC